MMNKVCLTKACRWVLASLGLAVASVVFAAKAIPDLVPQQNHLATTYDLSMEHTDKGAVIFGKLRKSAANPSRRLGSKVRADIVDNHGQIIAVYYGKPQRLTPAKHTHRARFKIEIDHLPESVSEIRVGYE